MELNGQLHAQAALPPGEICLDVGWIRGWVGPEIGTDWEKNPCYLLGTELLPCKLLALLSYPGASLHRSVDEW
jgi:hypothetical protein